MLTFYLPRPDFLLYSVWRNICRCTSHARGETVGAEEGHQSEMLEHHSIAKIPITSASSIHYHQEVVKHCLKVAFELLIILLSQYNMSGGISIHKVRSRRRLSQAEKKNNKLAFHRTSSFLSDLTCVHQRRGSLPLTGLPSPPLLPNFSTLPISTSSTPLTSPEPLLRRGLLANFPSIPPFFSVAHSRK